MGDAEREAFLLELGGALILAGAGVAEVQERLLRVAAAGGDGDARILVFPTALIVSSGPGAWATADTIPSLASDLRLDQISELYALVEAAERGDVGPEAGLVEVRRIRALSPRRGALVQVLAYAMLTVGLCLVLQPTPVDVALSALLGLLVGVLLLLSRGHHALTILVPALCATLVSALSFELISHNIADDAGLRTLIAPLSRSCRAGC